MHNKKEFEVHIIYDFCKEDLGTERTNWGVEHLAKHPDHNSYRDEKRQLKSRNT